MRPLLTILCLAAVLTAGEPPLTIRVEHVVIAPAAGGADREELDRLGKAGEQRLIQIRTALPGLPREVARLAREDVGWYEAEQERLAAARGGRVVVRRRIFIVAGDRMTVDADGLRTEIDFAGGRAELVVGERRTPLPLALPPDARPVADGKPADQVLGRATRRFEMKADGRVYEALVDTSLPNPMRHLVPAEDPDELSVELARLPGLPMRIASEQEGIERRIEVVAIERSER
jgi:hypothetical protein